MTLLRAQHLHKTYRLGRVDVPVLRGVSLDVAEREWVAILGASGSGKSTLLHLLGGLDRPDRKPADGGEPTIEFAGRALSARSSRDLDRFRASEVGFVFQFYHLLPELTVLENVGIAAMVRLGPLGYRRSRRDIGGRARQLLEQMGLGHRLRHRPAELSGGERQRVAIARALVNRPRLLLADEPTGNLDRETGRQILEVITQLRATEDLTILMVTHDAAVAQRAGNVVRLLDGRLAPEGPPERGG